jgi:hypothetical protein
MKTAVTIVLLTFLGAAVGYLVLQEARPGPASDAPAIFATEATPDASPEAEAHDLIVYYFHGAARCPTCLKMEQWAGEVVAGRSSPALSSANIAWRVVDVDEVDNEHFVQRYSLLGSAIVIVRPERDGPEGWRSLGRIWELVGDEAAFKSYIADEAAALLEQGS